MSDAAVPARRRGPGGLRGDERALAVAFVVGVAATTVHPAGLVLGGALVGPLAGSLRRAAVLGVEFGGVVLLAWAAVLAWWGTLGPVAGLWPLSGVAVGAGIAVPVLAALAARSLT